MCAHVRNRPEDPTATKIVPFSSIEAIHAPSLRYKKSPYSIDIVTEHRTYYLNFGGKILYERWREALESIPNSTTT
jgi:hypothetical protein